MRRIYYAANLQEAYLLLGMLEQDGITALVLNENAAGGLGDIPFTQAWPELWITEDSDESRARSIIAGYERGASHPPISCPNCGEDNPAQFQICWNCGRSLRSD